MKLKCNFIATAALAATCSATANATDVFNLEGYGPISRAMGGSGVAYDIGPAAMMLNPATLALMSDGRYIHLGVDIVAPDLKVKNLSTGETATSGNHGNNNGPYVAPELAFVYRRASYALGVGAFAAGGAGTQYGGSSFLSRTTTNNIDTGLDQFSRLLVLHIPVSAAYKVTEKLTLGGSLDVVWTSLNTSMLLDASQIGSLAAQKRLSGSLVPELLRIPGLSGGNINFSHSGIIGGGTDAWGVGGKLGLTYELTPDTRLGIAYNFKTAVADMRGHATLTAVSSVAGNLPLSGDIVLKDLQMPAQFTVGISHRFNNQWAISADYQRVFWASVMRNMNVGFVQSGSGATLNLTIPQNFQDINVFAIGAEYRCNENWTFRGGFQYAQESIPNNTMFAILAAIPTTHLTAGASYVFRKSNKLDFAMSYGLRKTLNNSSQPTASAPIEATHSQINAAISYQRRF